MLATDHQQNKGETLLIILHNQCFNKELPELSSIDISLDVLPKGRSPPPRNDLDDTACSIPLSLKSLLDDSLLTVDSKTGKLFSKHLS